MQRGEYKRRGRKRNKWSVLGGKGTKGGGGFVGKNPNYIGVGMATGGTIGQQKQLGAYGALGYRHG